MKEGVNEMEESGPTINQLNLLNKLRNESQEREEILQKYLKEKAKASLEVLSFQEASGLINELKKIKVETSGSTSDLYATGKQIGFPENLQDTDERRNAVRNYLKERGYEAVNHLKMNEASELIDSLMKLPKGALTNTDTASKKQLQFIKNLQNTDRELDITRKFLSDLKKTSIEELTRKEASSLIEKLKV